jgi:cation/acetate symporter
MLALAAIVAVTGGALGIGAWGVRWARTTSDLFVASRAITPWWNAAAISGEYLSAASFLGVAGLTMRTGLAALWLPVGFAAGYLALLLFVAAPLRRFGSYTIPDFVEGRLGSSTLRTASAVTLLAIGGLYLVPQLRGAGLALGEAAGVPFPAGIAMAAAIVWASVAFGGMRAVTYVQAFQFWVKLVAISVPACLIVLHLGGLPERAALLGQELPTAPAGGLVVALDGPQPVTFPRAATYVVIPDGGVSGRARAGGGVSRRARAGERVVLPAGRVELPAGTVVPVADGIRAQTGVQWARPAGGDGRGSPLFIYSLLVATFLGTMGLPHILVRFYTNATGSAARHTTVRVLGLLGLFYLFPVVYGLVGRALTPELYVTGDTDLVVLRLPAAVLDGWTGDAATALVAAGAFAAFVSTASGLLVSTAGTVAYDLTPARAGGPDPADEDRARRRRYRAAAVVAIAVPSVLAVWARGLDITILVSWSFALAASTFCPLLLLGIWWPRLTSRGALAGMVAGGLCASGGIAAALVAGGAAEESVLAQPALVSVPVAFLTMVLVSLRDEPPSPSRVAAAMRALHAPEGAATPRTDRVGAAGRPAPSVPRTPVRVKASGPAADRKA